MIASALLSADVTGLPSAFEATSQPRLYSSITAGPAANAALARKRAVSSRVWESRAKESASRRTELKSSPLFQSRALKRRAKHRLQSTPIAPGTQSVQRPPRRFGPLLGRRIRTSITGGASYVANEARIG